MVARALTAEQQSAVTRMVETDATILVAIMGAGKTVSALTAMAELLTMDDAPKRFIVACPAPLVKQWPREAAAWEHTAHLRIVSVEGTEKQRLKLMQQEADIWVVSTGLLNWMLKQKHGADGIILDELTKACGKQSSGLRNKAADVLTWRVGMTGTPVAQSFAKVYAMCRILDGGKAFGTRKDAFEAKYFTTDYMGFNLTIREGAADEILRKIAPLVHYVDVDRADVLPAILYRNVTFTMPRNTLAAYHMMRRELFAGEVEAANAAVASGKLRQLASGFLYDSETSEVLTYDTARTDCVLSVLGRMDRAVVFYEYDEQGASLLHALGDDASTDRADEPRYLIAQFRSMSHGVDGLQKIYNKAVFMHPLWSNDSFSQAVARLWRTGQEREVEIVTVCAEGSLDAIVQARVAGNATWMEMFIDHMRGES